ncbi:hypothetical protein LCGC14_1211950 [marine sediment metagenome]|uniref:SWIM-type domain-containing protein n=1 Tax=marine sediment metagenome TaxID=412755 RepID=A0A0F9LDL6_9ZZZZ
MIIAEAKTAYNTRAKQWRVTTGDEILIALPPGQHNKQQAQIYALEFNRPDLAAMAYKIRRQNSYNADVSKLALNAAYILADKLLYNDGFVRSQSRPGVFHQITYNDQPRRYNCTCEAMQFHPIWLTGIGWLCKHGLAAHMAYLMALELPQQPIPFNSEPEITTIAISSTFRI